MKRIFLALVIVSAISPSVYAEEGAKTNREFSFAVGSHLAAFALPIYGLHYRQGLNDSLDFRAAVEAGQGTNSEFTGTQFFITRLHGALLSKGWLYGGGGFSMINISATNALAASNLSVNSIEAIAGLRLPVGNGTLGTEFRYGVTGPSTFTMSGGFAF